MPIFKCEKTDVLYEFGVWGLEISDLGVGFSVVFGCLTCFYMVFCEDFRK